MLLIGVIVGLILIAAVVMIVIGMRDAGEEDPLMDRLGEYAARGEITDLEEIELSQPLTERVFFPVARKMLGGSSHSA